MQVNSARVRRVVLMAVVLFGGIAVPHAHAQNSAKNVPKMSHAAFDSMVKELSNWGRWGKEDQLGTINLITPEKRREAVKQVIEGVSVSLEHNLDSVKAVDNPTPFEHEMSLDVDEKFNMDKYGVFFHGFGHSHFDALSHTFYQGKLYNGFPDTSITNKGAGVLDAVQYKDGVLTRGVLIDIPVLRKLPYLETDAVITAADLDAWEKATGEHIRSGDAVFIRTGRWARRAAKGPWDIGSASAGLAPDAVRWLKKRDIAVLGSDAAHDAIPSRVEGVDFPIHILAIVAMGTPLLDQLDLEGLSKTTQRLHRTAFLLTFAPIRVPGGTGSLINPIATF